MSASATRSAPAFVSVPIDFLLIGGGSLLFFLVLPLFQDGSRTAAVIQVSLVLTWLANWPHFAATSFRLYGRTEHLRQYPVTAIAAPLIVLAGAAASLTWPLAVAPYFIKLFMLWSPYHYSGQTLGISLLYARRGGHRPEARERFLLASFIYGTFLMRSLAAETSVQGTVYYGVAVPGFGIPTWVATAFMAWTYLCGVALLGLLALRTRRSGVGLPALYLLPALSQYVWFVWAGQKPGYSEFVPFFHGVQYLVIAWAMQMKEQADLQAVQPTAHFIARQSALWYGAIFVGGAGLFYGLPLLVGQTSAGINLGSAVMLAAIQIHHFFVDGVIWKLRSSSVVSPLLVNIPELVRVPSPASQPQSVAA